MERLPPHISSHIMALAAEFDPEGFVPANTHTLLNCAQVSKAWLALSQPLLYNVVSMNRRGSAIAFLMTVMDTSNKLGRHVRRLSSGPALDHESPHWLLSVIEFTPNVVGLRAPLEHCRELQKHRVWNNIEHLRLFSNAHRRDLPAPEKLPSFQNETFPKKLQTLALEDATEVLCQADDWSRLTLPTLKTLTLIQVSSVSSISISEASPMRHTLLPEMPQMRCLKLVNPYGPRMLMPRWERVLVEKSETLTSLQISKDYLMGNGLSLLSPHLLPKFKKLERLHWSGSELKSDISTVRKAFPPSLRRVNLTLTDSPQCAEDFMTLLLDPSFLPDLELCPNVTVLLNEDAVAVLVKPSRIRSLLLLGYQVTRNWRQPGGVLPVWPLNPTGPVLCIPCLPYPGPYKRLLDVRALNAIKHLEARGLVISEE